MKAKELRQKFFDYFQSKGHEIIPSAPMVIKNDPTLMFTNAGMNQFKDIFLGNQPAKFKRIANSQKCLRVSGKHNDLEEVGYDTYHHTMFEMLGNWSFGDYFKKEAIGWGWEFLTKVLNIPEERLYATVFEGSKEDGISKDDEAYSYWKSCFSNPVNHILEGSKKDNFWEMGDTGPCGPCSEIHIDIRDDQERKRTPGHLLVNKVIHWLSKFGTWYLFNITERLTESWNSFLPDMLTPVWDSKDYAWLFRAKNQTMILIFSNRL